MPKLPAAALALAAGALALAGCGGSSTGTTPSAATPTTSSSTTASTPAASAQAPSHKLTLAANPEGQLKYDKSTLTASAGQVSIDFTNQSPLMHNMTIESSSGKIVGATPTFQGGSKTLDVNLKPGVYKFFCSVPGHRMAGMEGTLTVR